MSCPSQSDHKFTDAKQLLHSYWPAEFFWWGKWERLRLFFSGNIIKFHNNLCLSLQSDHSSMRQSWLFSNVYLGGGRGGFKVQTIRSATWALARVGGCLYAGPEGRQSEDFRGISTSLADETCVNVRRQHCTKSNKLHDAAWRWKRSKKKGKTHEDSTKHPISSHPDVRTFLCWYVLSYINTKVFVRASAAVWFLCLSDLKHLRAYKQPVSSGKQRA